MRRWWNWAEYLTACHPEAPVTFEAFEEILSGLYADFTFEFAAAESGVSAETLAEVADVVAGAGHRFSCHSWRSAAAGNLGGWQVSRTLFLISALLGAVATPGGTFPNAWNKFVPRPVHVPPHPGVWQELSWPLEYPLAQNEMSFLLPHFLKDGRGRRDTYLIRVYNPVWTNPDGLSWMEVLRDESLVGCFAALTRRERVRVLRRLRAADGGRVGTARHALLRAVRRSVDRVRQPVLRAARERRGEKITDTREVNPGEVWEENELWIELSWRIDPDGSLGIRRYYESVERPGEKLTVDEYYGWMFAHSVPGLPERAAAEGLTPLEWMRRYGAFEISRGQGALHEQEVPPEELADAHPGPFGRVYTTAPPAADPNIVPQGAPVPDQAGRRAAGVVVDGVARRGFPTPSGRLEFWSSTLAGWGWPEHALPGYIHSHVHPSSLDADQMVLLSTFRLPTQIHTRSANAKWLDELAHTNPVWIHPRDAARFGIGGTGDLVRVSTEIGYFVAKAWLTEGIRPGVVACSHHMGRWRLDGGPRGAGGMMATVGLDRSPDGWAVSRRAPAGPYESADPDSQRIWWSDTGVHQNLTFAVQPDPISGMHCWHQAVRLRPADPGDRHGDIAVDTAKAHSVYQRWLARTRPAGSVSPDGTRRPRWLMRPVKPAAEAFALPADQ